MSGDPKQCRSNAARCAELASDDHTPQLKMTFLELSKNWEKLAIQLSPRLTAPLGLVRAGPFLSVVLGTVGEQIL
jgi:hypothetical protein